MGPSTDYGQPTRQHTLANCLSFTWKPWESVNPPSSGGVHEPLLTPLRRWERWCDKGLSLATQLLSVLSYPEDSVLLWSPWPLLGSYNLSASSSPTVLEPWWGRMSCPICGRALHGHLLSAFWSAGSFLLLLSTARHKETYLVRSENCTNLWQILTLKGDIPAKHYAGGLKGAILIFFPRHDFSVLSRLFWNSLCKTRLASNSLSSYNNRM